MNRNTRLALYLLAVALTTLSACVAVPNAAPGAGQVITPVPTGVTPAPAQASPQSSAGETKSNDGVVALARQALAQQLKTGVGDITVVSSERVEWPDSCLGVQVKDINVTLGGCAFWHAVISIKKQPGEAKNALLAARAGQEQEEAVALALVARDEVLLPEALAHLLEQRVDLLAQAAERGAAEAALDLRQ